MAQFLKSEVLVSLLREASFIRAVTRELAQEPKVQTALGRPLIHMDTRHLDQQPLLVLCKLENVLAVLEGRLGPLLLAPQGAAVTQILGSLPLCAYFYTIAAVVVISFVQLILP